MLLAKTFILVVPRQQLVNAIIHNFTTCSAALNGAGVWVSQLLESLDGTRRLGPTLIQPTSQHRRAPSHLSTLMP